ncbi:MAG: hypothetical protein AAF414_18075 [Pseudomonadota bacterium]
MRVSADGQTLMIIGDAIISEALQVANPEITYALDGDADQAVETRRALLRDCASGQITIAATHFAFPGLGTVTADDGTAYRFNPL